MTIRKPKREMLFLGISDELDRALFNVLYYFAPVSQKASQEARLLASDSRVEIKGRRERVRRIVEIIDEHGWHNVRDTEVLRKFTSTTAPARGRIRRIKATGERRTYIRRKR